MKKQQRILLYDIETAGVNARKSDLGFVIVFGYKWLGERAVHALTLKHDDLKRFSDKKLLVKASELLSIADAVVAHYGSVFDKKFIQGRLLINHLPPVIHPPMRDTCFALRAITNFSSKRLKHAAKILQFRHQKLENNWPIAWFKVMQGDMKTLHKLAEYCKGDVLALEELYLSISDYVKAWKEKE